MIDDEVSEILELDVETRAIRVNELADEFRCGRVANEIMVLLCSPNSRFVSIGVYIVNEIHNDKYTPEIVNRLWELARHADIFIRMKAVSALYQILDLHDLRTSNL